jgi:hypothetical protein
MMWFYVNMNKMSFIELVHGWVSERECGGMGGKRFEQVLI